MIKVNCSISNSNQSKQALVIAVVVHDDGKVSSYLCWYGVDFTVLIVSFVATATGTPLSVFIIDHIYCFVKLRVT